MTIDVVDPITWVKHNRNLFFPGGAVDVMRLLAYVMTDALELGRGEECRIARHADWWLVSSDVDWLAQEIPVRDLFWRVVPAPQHGEHSMRAEILVNAYARDVFTAGNGQALVIGGTSLDPSVVDGVLRAGTAVRLLAFRMPPADPPTPDAG